MWSKGAEQETQFVPLTDTDELERLYELSHSQPVVLFKHSTTCPISSMAYDEMSRVEATPVSIIVVQRSRDISREIETRTGIRHESPQAIVLRNGQPVWNASHFSIKSASVERAVRENA
jgi:bacillithiol system protein YtxJ